MAAEPVYSFHTDTEWELDRFDDAWMGSFGLNTWAITAMVTAGDTTPLPWKEPTTENLGPVLVILVINCAENILCLLLWITGNEQNKELCFGLCVRTDVAGWDTAEQHFQTGEKGSFQML